MNQTYSIRKVGTTPFMRLCHPYLWEYSNRYVTFLKNFRTHFLNHLNLNRMDTQVYNGPTRRSRATLAKLTRTQQKVARLVALQNSDKEIADLLGVKPSTVVKHVKNIRDKWGLIRRTGIVAGALHSDFITLEELVKDFLVAV
jgi:DNA-binding CsgD family transcriptional regulator